MQNKIYINQDFFTQVDLTPYYTLQGQSKQGYKGKIPPQFEYRPQNFTEFIGQESAKTKAQTIIKGAKMGYFLHFLIDGRQGGGKTSLCQLVAKDLQADFIYTIGKQVDNDEDIQEIVEKINNSEKEFTVFMLDEVDGCDSKVLKQFNSIIESFQYKNEYIKPFLFCAATINKDVLQDNNPDLLDRIHEHIRFSGYMQDDIKKILILNANILYKNFKFNEYVIEKISLNCKYNPRRALSLLKQFVIEQDVDKVLQSADIIFEGLTKLDIKILQTLNNAPRAMGVNALASAVGLKPKEYQSMYEPFLVEYGYINRIPSRVIGVKGKETISKIGGIKL